MSSVYQDLARELVRTRRLAETRGAPQIIHSTIEGGAVSIRDGAGQLTGIVGEAFDGTYGSFSVAGPTPPTPVSPEVVPVAGGALVRIPGTWVDALVAPMDFGRWEVYASKDPSPSAIFENFKIDVTSPRGGEVTISLERDTDFWIWISARTESGKIGAPSQMVGPIRAGKMVESDLDIDWSQFGGSSITPSATEPEGSHQYGDLWLKLLEDDTQIAYRWAPGMSGAVDYWAELKDQGVAEAILAAEAAQDAAKLGAELFVQAERPADLPVDKKGIWVDSDDSNVSYTWTGSDWVKRQISTGAIKPNSLIAKDVIATGTVSAALLEALIVLATTIIAGDPSGNHVQINQNGMRVFTADPVDGMPNEVIRLGTETGDILGVTDLNGNLRMSVDENGRVSASGVTTTSLTIAGRSFLDYISDRPKGIVASFNQFPGFDIGPIFWGVGIAEVGLPMYAGRSYKLDYRMSIKAPEGDDVLLTLRYTQGADGDTSTQAPPPTMSSTAHTQWSHVSMYNDRRQMVGGSAIFTPGVTSRYRLGITAQRGPQGTALTNCFVTNDPVEIYVTDIGPAVQGVTGTFSAMGGSIETGGTQPPPPPPSVAQQYFVDLAPAGRASWTGGGQLIDWSGGDVYQGYQSANGNTRGQFWFDLPNITGNVDRVDVWIYFRHWYFNSGGTVRMGITDQRGVFTDHTFRTPWETSGWPKPGGREVLLPSDWWPLFKGTNNNAFNGRGTCIQIGPGIGTNQAYYGVATDARLRIYYTQ